MVTYTDHKGRVIRKTRVIIYDYIVCIESSAFDNWIELTAIVFMISVAQAEWVEQLVSN